MRVGHNIFAYHDQEEPGPVILSEIAKHTGLRPEDLQGEAGCQPSSVFGTTWRK